MPLMTLFLANTGSSTATLYKFIYTRLNSFKRRSMKRKITRIKKSISKADMNQDDPDQPEVIMVTDPSDPVDINNSNQSSKKSKISMKSFRFKQTDDKNAKKEPISEKKVKRAEKKQERAEILKKSNVQDSTKTTQEANKPTDFKTETALANKDKPTEEAPKYEMHKFNPKSIETVNKKVSDMTDALKRIDGLLDDENSLGDNISSYSEV